MPVFLFNFGLLFLFPPELLLFLPVDLHCWDCWLFFFTCGFGEPTGWLIDDRCTDPSDCLLLPY